MKGLPHKIKVSAPFAIRFYKVKLSSSKCARIEESSEEIGRNAKREELISTRVKNKVSME